MGGGPWRRHQKVGAAFFELLTGVRYCTVGGETTIGSLGLDLTRPLSEERDKRPDLFATLPNGDSILGDVALIHPIQDVTRLHKNAKKVGAAAKEKEGKKHTHYDDAWRAVGIRFVPLVFETYGRPGGETVCLTAAVLIKNLQATENDVLEAFLEQTEESTSHTMTKKDRQFSRFMKSLNTKRVKTSDELLVDEDAGKISTALKKDCSADNVKSRLEPYREDEEGKLKDSVMSICQTYNVIGSVYHLLEFMKLAAESDGAHLDGAKKQMKRGAVKSVLAGIRLAAAVLTVGTSELAVGIGLGVAYGGMAVAQGLASLDRVKRSDHKVSELLKKADQISSGHNGDSAVKGMEQYAALFRHINDQGDSLWKTTKSTVKQSFQDNPLETSKFTAVTTASTSGGVWHSATMIGAKSVGFVEAVPVIGAFVMLGDGVVEMGIGTGKTTLSTDDRKTMWRGCLLTESVALLKNLRKLAVDAGSPFFEDFLHFPWGDTFRLYIDHIVEKSNFRSTDDYTYIWSGPDECQDFPVDPHLFMIKEHGDPSDPNKPPTLKSGAEVEADLEAMLAWAENALREMSEDEESKWSDEWAQKCPGRVTQHLSEHPMKIDRRAGPGLLKKRNAQLNLDPYHCISRTVSHEASEINDEESDDLDIHTDPEWTEDEQSTQKLDNKKDQQQNENQSNLGPPPDHPPPGLKWKF
uniref:Uncharacterized protein n=1 Tax=Chromera velia CCMP2878 TaxID=1169474 RepID=A0A0G4F0A8_9ALVE|eukprot:Cvel_14428.t1-p1 / transcript=Cvel_14428.t1 / gene=Cvel_14428 / organism=Chromera_velia_CCMP2878 / gene_product=hypothetical protein / transcript_product=hypothetical protein / location=Cvel_scaffold1026:30651-36548(+) / protein_length=693 / sequence_SO=supercontig / SO=protein_coding / is_pseudo=false